MDEEMTAMSAATVTATATATAKTCRITEILKETAIAMRAIEKKNVKNNIHNDGYDAILPGDFQRK